MNEKEYHPPAEGSPDSADPLFRQRFAPAVVAGRPSSKPLGGGTSVSVAAIPRQSRAPPTDRTYELSTSARRSGG